MEHFRLELEVIELKVCEGCGGLWLRNNRGAYCNSCVRWLSEFPAPKRTRNDAQRIHRQRNRQRIRASRAAAQKAAVGETSAVTELVGVGGGK